MTECSSGVESIGRRALFVHVTAGCSSAFTTRSVATSCKPSEEGLHVLFFAPGAAQSEVQRSTTVNARLETDASTKGRTTSQGAGCKPKIRYNVFMAFNGVPGILQIV